MKMICRAVASRRHYLSDLYRQLPNLLVCWDRYRDPMETFLRAMAMAGEGPALHLEDDALLCEDFLRRASAEIERRPHQVLQFFSMHPDDPRLGAREYDHFVGAVCFYLPAGYSRALIDYAPRWPKRHSNPNAVDIMLRHWLRKERSNEPHWLVIPNLADHRIGPSSIDRTRSERRQSLTFRIPAEMVFFPTKIGDGDSVDRLIPHHSSHASLEASRGYELSITRVQSV